MQYKPAEIEPKWQKIWEERKTFHVSDDPKDWKGKPKFYILDMFPYPSGAGLHVGHPEGYTATDVLARLKRMKGFNVLHPMGWDSFGLPAERAAMRENIHPAIITKRNVDNFRRQIKRLGFSYDWDREIFTSNADYYRWTQWIFLKLYEKGLAYLAEVPVNWCPALGTVLANEEVKDGKYVETGDPVEKRSMKQWMLKITAYAERLLTDLETVDWPEGVKEMQRTWIGKSEGAEIPFQIKGTSESFTVFTTRPDTLFGCTYCVLAPEHPLIAKLNLGKEKAAVESYVAEAKQKTDLARTDLAKDKSGVFTGHYAVHPVTGKDVPVWVADYVLITYGTGAIMAVPGHDERDHEFAKKFGLPIVEVVAGGEGDVQEKAFTEDGVAVHSDFLNGLNTSEATQKMLGWLEQNKKGTRKVTYRLRDWLFSRQRYWGEPVPVVHSEAGEVVALSSEDLPVTLPEVDEYRPTEDGQPPLGRAAESWRKIKLKDGRTALRELNTMPQWAGSCWYYLRYLSPRNSNVPWAKEAEQYWMPVDLYIGGVEHAVLHLLYARFWHKVLYDCGLVHTKEPFQRLFNQGMILCESFRDQKGKYYSPEDIEYRDNKPFIRATGEPAQNQIEKMSKSKLNVVNPDDVINEYGADAMRLYELFMGPLDQVKPWKMDGVEGVSRFLARVWRLVVDDRTGELSSRLTDAPGTSEPELWRLLQKTIKMVEEQTESLLFNTCISQMMIFVNEAVNSKTLPKETVATFLKVVGPYAPHLAEELWQRLGYQELIAHASWPTYDPALIVDSTVTMVVQVNGKVFDKMEVARGLDKAQLEALAKTAPRTQKQLEGKTIARVVVVPDRLVNFVVAK